MNTFPNFDDTLEAKDIEFHFHGYTNAKKHLEVGPMIIENGEGIYVFDNEGNRYIEGLSGLWSVGVGFKEQRLVDAVNRQMQKLPFYHNFGHKSHGPAIEFAEQLIALAPVPMSKVFYTNSGSEANDTALKMIWYRSNAMGKPEKKKVIARQRGYHGVTIAAASLTGLPNNHRSFDLPIDRVLHTSSPHYWKDGRPGETEEDFATRCAEDLDALIQREGPDTIAAFFAEPVMGAGGVVTPPRTYFAKIQAVLAKYDILFVADEVICGFGRTGNMFGSHTYDIRPDIMVMSKQITSSYIPFSALMVNARVFDPIADESNRIGTFGHGFTAGGHPLGAAVALENLAIIRERNLVENARDVGTHFLKRLEELRSSPLVGEVRGVGLISAVELVNDKAGKSVNTPGILGGLMNVAMLRNGLISRNMADAVAFCPPLIITRKQADEMFEIIAKSLREVEIAMGS
ncbi:MULTISPECIES: aspartate aminotransferase family protein [unclassified Brucella]|uniref:aspartate aminotransferase family protein n=1 Tax=unclassified Brucella TaxID=2632610 RepID=UPI00217DCFAC|nr:MULTISPECIES: aspartate aminotransferase family protein [unclassified Brucella]UWF68338.1 aspartate aminotransferase family protein [Brucella sp. 1315]UWF71455.1 aspartate aminotransferase family protein [Brucella sp. 2594]